ILAERRRAFHVRDIHVTRLRLVLSTDIAELARIAHAFPRLDRLRRAPAVLADRRCSERQSAEDPDTGLSDLGARDEARVEANRLVETGAACGRDGGDTGQPRGALHLKSLHCSSSRNSLGATRVPADSTFKRRAATTIEPKEGCSDPAAASLARRRDAGGIELLRRPVGLPNDPSRLDRNSTAPSRSSTPSVT